jgi:hypothetical protein
MIDNPLGSSFDEWYTRRFGSLLESQDESNKEALRKVWNEVLQIAAEHFEFYDFEEYSGAQVAKTLRLMTVSGN